MSDGQQQYLELARVAVTAANPSEFTHRALPILADLCRLEAGFIHLTDHQSPAGTFVSFGFPPPQASVAQTVCERTFDRLVAQTEDGPTWLPLGDGAGGVSVYRLGHGAHCVGLLGVCKEHPGLLPINGELVAFLAAAIVSLTEKVDADRQLRHLNTYLTVSSMLSQSLDLSELLSTALYCCREAANAEEASILLLDDEKKNLQFCEVDGETKAALLGEKFPANRGLAGHVLQTQTAEIVHDVRSDPRFYGVLDDKTGFRTRSIIAVPLTAGEERIGVAEAVNKVDGTPFTEEERLVLVSIAEEIAFAIRNARIFDYVVDTYCKQRQGQNSCKGCKRPLGSWTPCVKHQESGL